MIHFAHPFVLVLLPVLVALAATGLIVMLRRSRRWDTLAAARLKQRLVSAPPAHITFGVVALWLMAAVFLLLALARPVIPTARMETTESPSPTVFLMIDLSRSMRVADVRPDRLELAKLTARDLLESLPDAQVGLISFAGRPVSHIPPTLDHRGVAEVVREMDETWPEIGGTNIAEAVRHAVREAKSLDGPPPGIILLTDGEEHAPDLDDALRQAANANMPILAIGFGTEAGGRIPYARHPQGWMHDRAGRPVISRMMPDVLGKMADLTGGTAHIHRSHAQTNAAVRDFVSRLEADLLTVERESHHQSLHMFPLALGLAAFLMGLVLDWSWRRPTNPAKRI